MVADVVDAAHKENKRFDILQNEKKRLTLYNNLELGENPEASIAKARETIEDQDTDGEKIKIFNEALAYYSKPQERVAEVPIYHSTGSYSLCKIIEEGAIDSSKNIISGERVATAKSHGGTSFAVGGYRESEAVSHFYARKNERESGLVIDSKNIFGDKIASGRELMEIIHPQLPELKPEEREFVENNLPGKSAEEIISFFDNSKFYFDYDSTISELEELKEKRDGKRGEITDENYKAYPKERIPYLENQIKKYNEASREERELLTNPFDVILVYDGSELPKKDLETFTTAGICERRTQSPIRNSKIKQIHAPYNKMDQIKDMLGKRIQELPEGSEERKALEIVELIPLEYFETKRIIKNII